MNISTNIYLFIYTLRIEILQEKKEWVKRKETLGFIFQKRKGKSMAPVKSFFKRNSDSDKSSFCDRPNYLGQVA